MPENRPTFMQPVHIRHRRFSFAAMVALLVLCLLAQQNVVQAQTRTGLLERLEYLEEQVDTLKQYRPNAATTSQDTPVKTNVPAKNAAQLEVSLSGMEEEIRYLRGKLEEQAFDIRRLEEDMQKFQADVDARLASLEEAQHSAQPPVIGGESDLLPPASDAEDMPAEITPPPSSGKVVNATESSASTKFNNASEHYDSAFKLLNESKYDEAATLFASFIRTYPKNELVGNAHYWLGETHYVQHQFEDAAEQFRKGFEAAPKGGKAPDNLLKLGMSLGQLKHTDEACVVFHQLLKKYPQKSDAVKSKAQKESTRLKCS